jgi:hypothetical protein
VLLAPEPFELLSLAAELTEVELGRTKKMNEN